MSELFLLPCEKCKGTNIKHRVYSGRLTDYFRCIDCGHSIHGGDDIRQARDLWNRRANKQEPQQSKTDPICDNCNLPLSLHNTLGECGKQSIKKVAQDAHTNAGNVDLLPELDKSRYDLLQTRLEQLENVVNNNLDFCRRDSIDGANTLDGFRERIEKLEQAAETSPGRISYGSEREQLESTVADAPRKLVAWVVFLRHTDGYISTVSYENEDEAVRESKSAIAIARVKVVAREGEFSE